MFACTGLILPPDVKVDCANVQVKTNSEATKKMERINFILKINFYAENSNTILSAVNTRLKTN